MTEFQLSHGGLDPAMVPDALEGGEIFESEASWRQALRAFAENKLAVLAVIVLFALVLFSFVGPHLYHHNVGQGNPLLDDAKPTKALPLGADDDGYDNLYQIMKGGQSSLEIGVVAAAIAVVIGTLYGAIAGLVGGVVDGILMRIVDVGLAIPTLFIILVLATKFNGTVLTLAIIIGLNQWLGPARLVRSEVLSLRERDYISAAKSMGASRTRLILRHLVPNSLSVVIVNATFQIADAILFTAAIGYLGFGLHYPQVDWGDELSQGATYLNDGYWWLIWPVAILLVLAVMSFNFIGDAARDAVDVRLRKR